MADQKKDEVKIEIPEDKEDKSAVEIDLEKKDEVKKGEPKYVTVEELEAVRKRVDNLSYIERKRQESVKTQPITTTESREAVTTKPKNDYDKQVADDWQGAVRGLSREEIRQVLKEERDQSSKQDKEQKDNETRESNKRKVLEKYPDLAKDDSEVSKKFSDVMNKNPDWMADKNGPLLVMGEVEDSLRADGRLDEFSRQAVDKEVERRVRTSASGLPKATTPPSKKTVTLSAEDREFCDLHEIKYETFAKNRSKLDKAASSKEGVRV